MRKRVVIILIAVMAMVAKGDVVFEEIPYTEDFENGLGGWQIGGRRAEGTNIADTVYRHGSMMGHIYKTSFTETTLYNHFDYDPGMSFQYDMEVKATSSTPPASNYYGKSGIRFVFYDENAQSLGWVGYITATTSYPYNSVKSDPLHHYNQVPGGQLVTYDLSVQDLLTQIAVNETDIDYVKMQFECYSSTRPYPYVSAELWVDNVNVPEPATLFLLASGTLGLLKYRRRF